MYSDEGSDDGDSDMDEGDDDAADEDKPAFQAKSGRIIDSDDSDVDDSSARKKRKKRRTSVDGWLADGCFFSGRAVDLGGGGGGGQ